MKNLLSKLRLDFPELQFTPGDNYYWSPKDSTVFYKRDLKDETAEWSLLHEVSHGALGHTTYKSDFELMDLEVKAWDYASSLARKYKLIIDHDHIQDCLDTYRDWLHRRSTCPVCGTISAQSKDTTYRCYNCKTSWSVSNSRFCRPYRKVARK